MLFLVGHGLVVGRDAFLPDDNPNSAIGLTKLGEILKDFQVPKWRGHSARVYRNAQLFDECCRGCVRTKGQGEIHACFSRDFLCRLLALSPVADEDLPRHRERGRVDVDELVKSLHTLTIQYSVDFMHAGYSSDICLCSLDEKRVDALTDPI